MTRHYSLFQDDHMRRRIAAIMGAAMLLALPAMAQERVNVGVDEVRITVEADKARMIQLDRNADVVLIANPEIADVVVQTARTIFLLGKAPGETSLFILGADGSDIMRSEVVVTEGGAPPPAGPAVEATGPKMVKVYRSLQPNVVVLPQN